MKPVSALILCVLAMAALVSASGDDCSLEGEACDGNCCDPRDACSLATDGDSYFCVRQECKPLNRLCNHPIQCCSGYCQAVAVGTALCRNKPN